MAFSTDSSPAADSEGRQLYERYQAAESVLEMGNSTDVVMLISTQH